MKNNGCVFEKLLKIQKNSVFLFGISFSRFKDTFLYCANYESDDVMRFATIMVKY